MVLEGNNHPVTGGIISTSLKSPGGSNGNHSLWYLVNYKKGGAITSLSTSVLENREYNNIGHFVPVNAMTIAVAQGQTMGSVSVNSAITTTFNDIEVWGGDCFADFFDFCRLEPVYAEPGWGHADDPCHFDGSSGKERPDYAISMIFPVESNVNTSMRKGDQYAKVATRPLQTWQDQNCGTNHNTGFEKGIYYATDNNSKAEEFLYNRVGFVKDIVVTHIQKSSQFLEELDFPLMEVYSEPKTYTEYYDSFRKIKVNSIAYAEGRYGEITQLERLFGSVYVLQKNGFARMLFNERQMIPTSGGNLYVGTGDKVLGHDYISTVFGTQHQWGVINNGKAIYFPDAEKGKLLKFSQAGLQPISDDFDQHEFFSEKLKHYWRIKDLSSGKGLYLSDEYGTYDNPLIAGGIHGVWDSKNDSIFYTFTRILEADSNGATSYKTGVLAETIEFNEIDNTFKSYYSFTPEIYLKFKESFLSNASQYNAYPVNESQHFWVHGNGDRGKYYGRVFDSKLKFIVNPILPYSKVFDNVRLNINQDAVLPIINENASNPALKNVSAKAVNQVAQTISFDNYNNDDRPRYREDFLVYPLRELDALERIRGKYITIEYLITNANNKPVRITSNETQYRISQRN